MISDPEDVQEVIGFRFLGGPIVACDKRMDATRTIVAGLIFMGDSEPPLLLCQPCTEDFQANVPQVYEG